MDRIKTLDIIVPQGMSGSLTKGSQFIFQRLDDESSHDVSLVLPASQSPFVTNVLHPIFDMNVPEGYLADQIKRRMAKHIQVDQMRLLSLISGNQIGRVDYREPAQAQVKGRTAHLGLQEILTGGQSKEVFEFLVESYYDSGISGVQPKVLAPDKDLVLDSRTSMLSSNLIIKSGVSEFPGLAQNEFLCMDAARRAGLETPPFWLSDDGQLFVMERFDLRGKLKLGFEDIAVLMQLPKDPHDNYKYSQSYEAIARVLGSVCAQADPAGDLLKFFTSLCLTVMVRNGDAHLKNFGVLYDHPGDRSSVRLSPAYDITTTTIYTQQSLKTGRVTADRTMALKMNGRKDYPDRAQLLEFGHKLCRIRQPELIVEAVAQAMVETLAAHRERIEPGIWQSMKLEWESGMAMALNPSLGSGMRRKPVTRKQT